MLLDRKTTSNAERASGTSDRPAWSAALWRSHYRFASSLQLALAVALIVCGTMAGLGLWLTSQIRQSEIVNAADRSAFAMNVLFAPALHGLSHDQPVPQDVLTRLDDTLAALQDRPIVTAMIWWRDGTVAYSTDRAMIGRNFGTENLQSVFDGNLKAHLETLTDHGTERQDAMERPLLEVYAPLHDIETNEVFAVGEFYEDATHLLNDVRRLSMTIWATVIVATGLMLAMLALVASRARSTVETHRAELQRKLVEANELAHENAALLKVAEKARIDAFQINEALLHKIGADIHDGPLQLLGLIMLRLEGPGPQPQGSTQNDTQRMKSMELLARTLQELRDLSSGLTLPEIRELDLAQTIRLAAQRHENITETSVAIELGEMPDTPSMPLKTCVYRIVQEALSNAFWHAEGAGQTVEAALIDNEKVQVRVMDSGPGFSGSPEGHNGTGLGLPGLVRRVEAFGGTIEVDTRQNGGTVVTAEIPLAYHGHDEYQRT